MTVDASQNYLVWDNRESVTFASAAKTGDTRYTWTDTVNRPPNNRELTAANGAYTASDRVFCLPVATRPSGAPDPKPRDRITDGDGVEWTILETIKTALKSTWKLMTRDLILVNQLRDIIDIQRPAVTFDVAGSPVRGWPDDQTPTGGYVARGLPARVQPVNQEIGSALGVTGFKGTYAVYIDRDLSFTKLDRVAWLQTDGSVIYLDILGQHDLESIQNLNVLDCVLQP